MQLNKFIDHTLLTPTATTLDIDKLCDEAIRHNFYAVCINGNFVARVKQKLKGSAVKIAAVVGFPLGASTTEVKVFEAKQCIQDGADEIDMVINIGWMKADNLDAVEEEIAAVKNAIGNKVLKVIIETGYLTDDEKRNACKTAVHAKADFVKTSTGFGTGGAEIHDVKLMKKEVGKNLQIKASGGIKNAETAFEMINAGASRIGTSSGIAIVTSQN